MNTTFESVRTYVEEVSEAIRRDDLSVRARHGAWSPEEIMRYTAVQRAICTVWPAFLGAAAHRLSDWPAMKQALLDNAACEVGIPSGGVGHVTMAHEFCASLGLSVAEMGLWVNDPMAQRSVAGMTRLVFDSPAKVLSYIWANESYATVMFASFLPMFEQVSGCNVRYMREHVEVDGDTHAPALEVGVREMLVTGAALSDVLAGVEDAGRGRMLYLHYIRTGEIRESWVRSEIDTHLAREYVSVGI